MKCLITYALFALSTPAWADGLISPPGITQLTGAIVAGPGSGSQTTSFGAGTTGSGPVVLQVSPALTTPNIGVATGSSVIVTGLVAGGTGSFNGAAPPAAGPSVELIYNGTGFVQCFNRSGSIYCPLALAGSTIDLQPGGISALSLSAAKLATFKGDISFTGTIPTVTGTGTPTIALRSTDTSGEVTAGASATSVVITFSVAKTNAPFCTVTNQSTLASFVYAISTTAITITQTANTGNKIDYVCSQN